MLLDPKTLIGIKDLSILAKTVIDGFQVGANPSKIKGTGMEFSNYRSYQAGDDLRNLDWKLFARSDRYYIRQAEIETNIHLRLLVDASGSMNHEEGGIKKIDYARFMAASLAFLGLRQGDALALEILAEGEMVSLPPRNDVGQLQRIYFQLENIIPQGPFILPEGYQGLFNSKGNRSMIIFLTDLYQRENELISLLDSLSALGHEIIIFHLMGNDELEGNFHDYRYLEDLESGMKISVPTMKAKSQVRTAYQNRMKEYLSMTQGLLAERNIDYTLLDISHPLDQGLRDYLNLRNR